MRIYLVAAISIVIFASCSTSKNTYRDFNSAKNTKAGNPSSSGLQSVDKYPLWINTSLYTASANKNVLPLVNTKDIKAKEADEMDPTIKKGSSAETARRYKELSKLQRKEFRKAMRESMRRYVMPPSTKKETRRRQIDG
jgi:PBP1b-binding outer membrane lipoprotein LpoB